MPGCIPIPFGHVGDGNIHFNVLPPIGILPADFRARWPDLSNAIDDAALALDGTISAEHGIGQIKRAALRRMRSPDEFEAMKTLKMTFDPWHILNPGKIFQHPRDEAGFFQGQHHLVDGWSGDLEMATHVSFGRGPFEDPAGPGSA